MDDSRVIQCPYCGTKGRVSKREMEVLSEREECQRKCLDCNKTFTIYYFDDIFCTYAKV